MRSDSTSHVKECIRNCVLTIRCLKMMLNLLIFSSGFTSAVELNEVGFKFVRKCINYIETKGDVSTGDLSQLSSVNCPEGGIVES